MNNLTVFLSRTEIDAALTRLSSEIRQDYSDKNPLILGVLKGSFIFLADLVRKLDFQVEIDFITLSSYGNTTQSCGDISMDRSYCADTRGRHVLVVEDIVDTGLTLHFLFDLILKDSPASLKLCSLLDKPSRRKVPVKVDYRGFMAPDKFMVGYGLDCAGKWRNLPDIRILEENA